VRQPGPKTVAANKHNFWCMTGQMSNGTSKQRSDQACPAAGIPAEIQAAAERDGVDALVLYDAVRTGTAVVPANRIHAAGKLQPIAIGRLVRTKINANLGASPVRSSDQQELAKLEQAIQLGADTVMDLSTGGNLDAIREAFIAHSTVPVGTVPVYQMISGRSVEELTVQHMLNVIEKQARQGVDFFTIHAGILKEHLPLIRKRVAGIVSRGGSLLAKWMIYHNRQNPLFEHFDEICAIMREYNVAFSLGDGLRPGCLADATDEAQLAELRTLGELTLRARQHGCQVIVEGPGHVPLDQIQYNMELQQQVCHGAPFYVLGPLVTDVAAGYDHIAAAIGATLAAYYGASFLCYVTPKEHLGLPDADDVREGIMAFKIAAHAADVGRGLAGARDRDDELSRARSQLDWQGVFKLLLDSRHARQLYQANECPGTDYCTMCGKDWCAVRINREVMEMLQRQDQPTGATDAARPGS